MDGSPLIEMRQQPALVAAILREAGARPGPAPSRPTWRASLPPWPLAPRANIGKEIEEDADPDTIDKGARS